MENDRTVSPKYIKKNVFLLIFSILIIFYGFFIQDFELSFGRIESLIPTGFIVFGILIFMLNNMIGLDNLKHPRLLIIIIIMVFITILYYNVVIFDTLLSSRDGLILIILEICTLVFLFYLHLTARRK
jgi:hypothetical protein